MRFQNRKDLAVTTPSFLVGTEYVVAHHGRATAFFIVLFDYRSRTSGHHVLPSKIDFPNCLVPVKEILLKAHSKWKQSSGMSKSVGQLRHCTCKGINDMLVENCYHFKRPCKRGVCV